MELTTFGDRLKALRQERNLLQSDFGEIIGERLGTKRLSPSAIGSYERNEREPAFSLLKEMADFFGVSIDYLLCRSNERMTVESYVERDALDFKEALATLNLTYEGRSLTEQEKLRIYDIAFTLLWQE